MTTKSKKALITGITGQDGTYLAELLVEKGYDVYGLIRRTSGDSAATFYDTIPETAPKVHLVEGNMRDLNTISRAIKEVMPDEIYNLAAQSHVGTSFQCPEETLDINYFGLGRVVIEAMEVNRNVRIYQASTSEMFGTTVPPQNEHSPMHPVSPYAKAKLHAHEDYVLGYRQLHQLHISSGILFNHESPRRGKQFVTRKITHTLARITMGLADTLTLGNMDAKRDWGFAGDYVKAMWQMLQAKNADDYVVATGRARTVREFVAAAANALSMELVWEGSGVNEVARNRNGAIVVKVDEHFYRPVEVDYLEGDATKAKTILGWEPTVSFDELVAMMAKADLKAAEYEKLRRSV